MTHVEQLKGVLNLIDCCEFHADILKNEIENSGDDKLKSSYQDKLMVSIHQLKEDYLKKLRKASSKGGRCGV
jgi:hypothetical protein